jgi:hypothetical protein
LSNSQSCADPDEPLSASRRRNRGGRVGRRRRGGGGRRRRGVEEEEGGRGEEDWRLMCPVQLRAGFNKFHAAFFTLACSEKAGVLLQRRAITGVEQSSSGVEEGGGGEE